MNSFSFGWLFIGLIILIAGAFFVRYYQWVADNVGAGVSSYDRYRLVALIICAVGLIVMTNLHLFILNAVVGLFLP